MLLTSMSISSQNVFKTLLLFILTIYNKQTYDIFCICVELTASLLVAGLTHTHTHTHTLQVAIFSLVYISVLY